MKIVCTQENLRDSLQAVSKIVANSNTLPILNNILLKTENGQLRVSATNLEVAINTFTRCKIEQEGTVCVPAKIFTTLITNLPDQNITLEADKDGVAVSTENYHTKLKTLPPEEFPLIPAVDKNISTQLPGQHLKQALDAVVFAAATSETQPELAGILFVLSKNTLKLVATDRYRLAEKSLILSGSTETKNLILPHRTAVELSRIIGLGNNEVTLSMSDNQISFEVNSTTIISRLVEGQFPDYQQIIPENFNTNITVDKTALVNALKTGGVFSYASGSISFEFGPGKPLKLSATSHDIGETVITIPAETAGNEGTVLLNYRYVLEALSVMPSEQVVVKVVNDGAPVVFSLPDSAEYVYLVMPIKN